MYAVKHSKSLNGKIILSIKRKFSSSKKYDVAIIGGGIGGFATAARLQAKGLRTCILESHSTIGGCAGYYEQNGFSFDVGATTFVDFEKGGVGGEFLDSIGYSNPLPNSEVLPGYKMHLPDGQIIHLFRDYEKFSKERIRAFGDSDNIREFWSLMDKLASVFWKASRSGIKLPFQTPSDLLQAANMVPPQHWHLSRYLNWSVADLITKLNLWTNKPLIGMLRCLVEDTVHSNDLKKAPLINSALGISIRGAGLTRPFGGAKGFWIGMSKHYKKIGGDLFIKTYVRNVDTCVDSGYLIHTNQGNYESKYVVSSLPAANTVKLFSKNNRHEIVSLLEKYIEANKGKLGGGIVIFLGIPDAQVLQQESHDTRDFGFPFTHHQILENHDLPLGNGNNMFISISSPNDTESAPKGHRAVMISTHCEAAPWFEIKEELEYETKKQQIGEKLLQNARKVFPQLAKETKVFEIGTPRTYFKYTKRVLGSVGGFRLELSNSNQWAIPQNIGEKWGVWCVGDSTWPGLGTVACVLGSRIASNQILKKFGVRSFHSQVENSHKSPFPSKLKSMLLSSSQLSDFLRNSEDVHKLLLRYAVQHPGPFVPIAFNPFETVLLVNDAEISKQILHGMNNAFKNRTSFPIIDYTYHRFMSGTSPSIQLSVNMGGVTFTNGETWKKNRMAGVKLMGDPRFLIRSISPILDCTDQMIQQWKGISSLNLGVWISRLGIEAVGHLVFGIKLGSLDGESSPMIRSSIQTKDLVTCVRGMLDTIQEYIYVPLPSYFFSIVKTKSIRRLDQSVDQLRELGNALTERLMLPKLEKTQNDCLAATLINNYPQMDKTDVQALLMDLLGAGHDTTANLITFTLAAIIENEEIDWVSKLKSEIQSFSDTFGERSDYNQEESSLVLDFVEHKMPILDATVTESMRLFPLGAAFSRVSTTDVQMSGFKIPGGNSPAYIPFGGGSRGCLGGRFGILEAKLVIIRVLQKVQMKKHSSWKKLDSILAFTLRPKYPVMVDVSLKQ